MRSEKKTRRKITAAIGAAVVGFGVATTAKAAPQVGTIWYISLENHNFTQPNPSGSPNQLVNNAAAPYLNSLITPGNANAAQVSYATNYLNAGVGVHPSEPNYVWAEAGTDFGIHTDNDPSAASNNIFTAPHLTAKMNSAGVTWNNYQEDVERSTGPTVSASGTAGANNLYYGTNQYNYAVKHNPMAFFTDTATQNVKNFSQLRSDITNNSFARYNWITPNQYNDMHSALSTNFTYNGQSWAAGTDQEAVAIGDNFLATIIPQIKATAAYQNNGAIVIWMDETVQSGDPLRDATYHPINEIVISPLAKGNAYASNVEMSHSSDIATLQELLGLSSFNNAIPAAETNASGTGYNAISTVNDLSSLFQAGAVPEPASLSVLGLGVAGLLSRRRRSV